MKKMLKYLMPVALLVLTILMAGCGDETTTQAAPNNEFSKTGTLQGALLDAVTGKRIADPLAKIVMVRGDATVNASKYITDATNVVAGEFAFTGIPFSVSDDDDTSNITYRVVVVAPGYQRFEAEVPAHIAMSAGNTYDSVYNFIRNIYLFPEGVTAANYTVKVRYDGAAVPGATVQLLQNLTLNDPTITVNTNRLNPTTGLMPVLSATTDASGNAVFAGSGLVLGGSYTPVVLPVKATANATTGMQADQLEQKYGTTFNVGGAITGTATAGTSTATVVLGTEQTIVMVGANNDDSSLFVTSVSNSTGGILADSGALVITFNRPVTVNNNNRAVFASSVDNFTGLAPTVTSTSVTTTNTVYGYGATIASSSSLLTTAKLTAFGATADVRPVVATLDATRTILTLTPKFSVAKAAGDFDLRITYSDTPSAANIPAAVTTATTVAPIVTTTVAYSAALLPASVSPVDKPELQYGIFAANPGTGKQVLLNGAPIGATVRISAPAAGM